MELYEEIIAKVFQRQYQCLKTETARIVETECYKALQKIKKVIEDDSLDDKQCFARIEKIVIILENIGSDGGTRHNFG